LSFSAFTHESFSGTTRLKTGFSVVASLSTVK